MRMDELVRTAHEMMADGKGLLAADESTRNDHEAAERDRGRVN